MVPLRPRPARLETCLVVLAWCVLFVLTHWPQSPRVLDVPGLDKVAHLAGFAVLSFLCCWAVFRHWRLTLVRSAGVVAVLAGYAAIDELLQIPIPHRTADPLDWLADVAGATCGVVAFALVAAVGTSLWKMLRPIAEGQTAGNGLRSQSAVRG